MFEDLDEEFGREVGLQSTLHRCCDASHSACMCFASELQDDSESFHASDGVRIPIDQLLFPRRRDGREAVAFVAELEEPLGIGQSCP